MARRRRNREESPFDELLEMIVFFSSKIPWPFTLLLALLLFFLVPSPDFGAKTFTQPTEVVPLLLSIALSFLLKYIVPAALVVGAVTNLFTAVFSFSLFKSISRKGAKETIKNLSWQNFEFLLSEWFKKEGFNSEISGGGGPDGGVDIVLHKNGELFLVQCKHFKAWKVSVKTVRELYGVMAAQKAAGGYVVTSGRFTNEARAFAQDKNIELIDGRKLESILEAGKVQNISVATLNIKTCPRSGHELVEKSGKYGKFLSCSAYPSCRYTENI